jgi:hypothetical protein
VSLAEVARELYALAPGEFTAARNARAKQARAGGDRELAGQVQALRKPTAAAWAVDALVRHHPDAVADLLALGAQLRDAQEARAGDRLRELNRRQHELMAVARRHAEALAAEAGQALTGQVAVQLEGTLRAAMTDLDAADAVRTGLLTSDLQSTGFGPVEVGDALAVPGAPALMPASDAGAGSGRAADDAEAEAEAEAEVEVEVEAADAGPPAASSGAERAVPPRATPARRSRGKAEREQADREQADREQTDREQTQREKADREKADREKAERDEAARRDREDAARRQQDRAEAARRARRAAAEEDAALAQQQADEADEALRAADEAVDALARRHQDLSAQIEELTARLHELEAQRRAAGRDQRHASTARDAAARAAQAAARRARGARTRLDEPG